jgi:DNA primase
LKCPDGLDPDELIQREGAEGVRLRIARAMPAADLLIEEECRTLAIRAAIEQRIAALSRVAAQFESVGARVTPTQVRRLAQLVGCRAALVEGFLARRRLLA